jgi:hypothetical protein
MNSHSKNKWNLHPTKMTTARMNHTAIAIDNHHILIIGGKDSSWNVLNSVEIFDSRDQNQHNNKNNTYPSSFLPNMLTARYSHASVICNNHIYVMGGFDTNHESLTSVERLNIHNPTEWERVGNMNYARGGLAAVSHGDTIFVFGGEELIRATTTTTTTTATASSNNINETSQFAPTTRSSRSTTTYNILSSVETYNTTSNHKKWEILPTPMKEKRFDHAATIIENKIYIYGGAKGNILEIYDTSIQVWENEIPILMTMGSSSSSSSSLSSTAYSSSLYLSKMSVVTIGKSLIVCGGIMGDFYTPCHMIVVNTETKKQFYIKDRRLYKQRNAHAAVVLDDNAMFILGGDVSSRGGTSDSIEYVSIKELMGVISPSSSSLSISSSLNNQNSDTTLTNKNEQGKGSTLTKTTMAAFTGYAQSFATRLKNIVFTRTSSSITTTTTTLTDNAKSFSTSIKNFVLTRTSSSRRMVFTRSSSSTRKMVFTRSSSSLRNVFCSMV